MTTTAHTITARKPFLCESYPTCGRTVHPGDQYARCVAFPGDDANNSHRPWRLRLCEPCYTRYGQAMPPPPRKRTREAVS